MRATGLDRWGAGGVRVSDVEVLQVEAATSRRVDATIHYDARSSIGEAHFAVGFVDEADNELGASVSPLLVLEESTGVVQWQIECLPLRPGVYFPIVCVLSAQGVILDRWKLDRPVVFDTDAQVDLGAELGPTDFGGTWLDERSDSHSVQAATHRVVRST